MGRLREEIEDRIETRSLLMLAVVAWISIEAFDAAPEQLAATTIGSAIAGGAGLVADAFDLQDGVRTSGLGLASLFGGAALFAAEGAVVLPAALGLVGLWLAVDGAQSLRHAGIEEPAEAQPDGEAVYRRYLRRRIRELLSDRSRSRTELHEAMDADADDIDAALAELRERDLVSLRGGVYHRDTPETPGRLARGRNWLAGIARRLGRPVTVEFRDDDPYGEREETTPDTATSHGEWGSRSTEDTPDDGTESVADEERVRQRERE
ncbi:MAG: hypothetical protein ABEH88_09540 [Halobacteriales archaeon]